MNIREEIFKQARQVAEQQQKTVPPLTDDLHILESGFDSLCIAILIAQLDDHLDADPFESGTTEIPVTFGDLVRIYQAAIERAGA